MMAPFVGLHTSMYLAQEELAEIIAYVPKAVIIAQVDQLNPLEKLALRVLKEAGKI
jgi:hypothetical protein